MFKSWGQFSTKKEFPAAFSDSNWRSYLGRKFLEVLPLQRHFRRQRKLFEPPWIKSNGRRERHNLLLQISCERHRWDFVREIVFSIRKNQNDLSG
jgi:hypothetical protein